MTLRKALSEAEWRSAASPHALLVELVQHRETARRRRLRLFACACCRQVWHLLADEDSRQAVAVAERYADGRASGAKLDAAWRSARAVEQRARGRVLELTGGRTSRRGVVPANLVAAQQARGTAAAAEVTASETISTDDLGRAVETVALLCAQAAGAGWARWEDGRPVQHAVEAIQCALLRDLFDPFHPPVPPPPAVLASNGGAARRLAQSIYEGRRFEDLPVLADLLEEAGLTDAGLLGHLRGPGPHALGCAALDAVLQKS
jgi:hypothetical protein